MDYLSQIQDATINPTPYLCYQPTGALSVNGNLDALLSNLGISNSSGFTTQNIPSSVIHSPNGGSIGNAQTSVYQVSEDIPIDIILRQFGIDLNTLLPSNTINNYIQGSRSLSQVNDYGILSPSNRYLVCQEVSGDQFNRQHGHSSIPFSQNFLNVGSDSSRPIDINHVFRTVWNRANQSPTSSPRQHLQSDSNRPRSPMLIDRRNATSHVWNKLSPHNPPNSDHLRISPNPRSFSDRYNTIPYHRQSEHQILSDNNRASSPVANVWNRSINALSQKDPSQSMANYYPNSAQRSSFPDYPSIQRSSSGRTLPVPPSVPRPASLTTLLQRAYGRR